MGTRLRGEHPTNTWYLVGCQPSLLVRPETCERTMGSRLFTSLSFSHTGGLGGQFIIGLSEKINF